SLHCYWIAVGIQKGIRPEGAGPLGGRGQLHQTRTGPLNLTRALIVREPEKLVFPEWTPDRVAELVTPQFRFSRVEETTRVEFVMAQVVEHVTVNAVGT